MKTMKRITTIMMIVLMGISTQVYSQARVQVIHNSADEAARFVDVWLDDMLLIDNFEFRTATPFVDAPAGTEFRIAIQPSNSTSPLNPLWENTYTLEDGEKYVLVANGLVDPNGYTPFVPFDIYVYPFGQFSSNKVDNTDVLVFHGSTDAPTVDVVEVQQGAGTIVDNLNHGDFAGYLELPTADYSLQLRDMSGTEVVAQYAAPLQTLNLQDQALVVLASGFLNTAVNKNGPEFGLYAALPTGGNLIMLPSEEVSTARVQVIHNAADMAAEFVDVWIDDQKAIENFQFRTSTPFVDLPANAEITISIKATNSTMNSNALWSQNFILEGGERYLLVANGIVSNSGYDPISPFDIYVYDEAEELAGSGMTAFNIFHGSTDAPVIDIWDAGSNTLVFDNLEYGTFTDYIEVPTDDYTFEVRDESGSEVVVKYNANFNSLGLNQKGVSIIASGFFTPQHNSDGPNFGMYVSLPEGGTLIPLSPVQEFARVQVIHNSADMAAEVVDVWLDDILLIDNFEFRTATPYIDAPANADFTIAIQPSNSTSSENPLWSNTYNLTAGETYQLIANGIVSPTGYDPVQTFDIYVFPAAREMSNNDFNTDVLVFHGSTDAPTVDIYEVGVGAGMIIDDLMYGDFAGYLELETQDYILEIRDETGSATVASYVAPLATLGLQGQAITVVASGFLNTSNNSNGADFGLYVALPTGGDLVGLTITTSVAENNNLSEEAFNIYPNPANSFVNIDYSLTNDADVEVEIFDITGNKVYEANYGSKAADFHTLQVNTTGLSNGLYILRMNAGSSQLTKKLKIVN